MNFDTTISNRDNEINTCLNSMINFIHSESFKESFNKEPKDATEKAFEKDCALLGEDWRSHIKENLPELYTDLIRSKNGNAAKKYLVNSIEHSLDGDTQAANILARVSCCEALKDLPRAKTNINFYKAMCLWVLRLKTELL